MESLIIGKKYAFSLLRNDRPPFWLTGIFTGENPTHYFFRVKEDKEATAFLRTVVSQIEPKEGGLD